ncbi:AcrR family transcriptional regulator [Pedobacter cryoconitis]|uniref:AcrR family transcriptional regulator n=1 Tax=Pedobacter cryoconitis TaxID=188932 RepID=A0A7W9E0N4_9SPHI|nr:TetR/AcrR family transcriptional regulator [Pedobacter cryoconitis]MBB5638647.1 AcrR family transcriptional regulator [Pedobacter cryoconitis]
MKQKAVDPKTRILETATRLFYTQGYHATGINQIIQEAGVARASLYTHYQSKEELCIAFLNFRHVYWFKCFREFIGAVTDPEQQLMTAFDFLISMNDKEDFRGCAFMNILSEISPADTTLYTIIQHHKQNLRDTLASILPHHTQLLKDHIYLLFESAMLESHLYRNQWPVLQAKKMLKTLL